MDGECGTCGRPTELDDSKRCNLCWEVERRIDTYLRQGGLKAKEFLAEALLLAANTNLKQAVDEALHSRGPELGPVTLTLAEGGRETSWQLKALSFSESLDPRRYPMGLVLIAAVHR